MARLKQAQPTAFGIIYPAFMQKHKDFKGTQQAHHFLTVVGFSRLEKMQSIFKRHQTFLKVTITFNSYIISVHPRDQQIRIGLSRLFAQL